MKELNLKDFRKELLKALPGYKWTVRQQGFLDTDRLIAIGTQSSGMNRLSTVQVTQEIVDGQKGYRVKSSGNGKSSGWLSESYGNTLKKAVRNLQQYYERTGAVYLRHAKDLESGRQKIQQ